MLKSNILAFLFTIGSFVFVAVCIVLYNQEDRTAPEFRFTAMELLYDENVTTNADLLEGIAAYDGADGDVSDRIVVEKVVVNHNKGTVVVYYAVSDNSGNVRKQSRVFPMRERLMP